MTAMLLRTVSQARDADLAQVHCGRHGNTEWTFGNMIAAVGHSNAKRTLKTKQNVRDYLQLSILETMSTIDIHSFILLINTNKQVLTYKSPEAEAAPRLGPLIHTGG